MIELTDKEREILNCIVEVWDENNSPLFGDASYQEVFDLLDKLGLERPVILTAFIDKVNMEEINHEVAI